MVQTVPTNTYNALVNAPTNGIVPRDFVWIEALNTATDEIEQIGVWNGDITVDVDVVRPDTGATVTRTYHGLAGLMQVPSIPSTMKLEVRSLKLTFSNLSPDIINAVMVYNPKGQSVEIHRGLLDPVTMNLVDPAICRFDGVVNRAPFKRAKAGNDGQVTIEAQSHARTLALGNPAKMSDEFYKRRSGDRFCRYVDIVPKIVWGQDVVVHESHRRKKEKFFNGR